MSDIGNKFRAAREARGIEIDTIARDTKISGRFLQAIERAEFDALPGGIYTRGFIRTYASVLGLDPQEAISEFEQVAGHHEHELIVRNEARRRQSADRKLYGGAAVALGVLIILFYAFSRPPAPSVPVNHPADQIAGAAGSVQVAPEARPIEEPPPPQRNLGEDFLPPDLRHFAGGTPPAARAPGRRAGDPADPEALFDLVWSLRIVAGWIEPVMPGAAARMRERLGVGPDARIRKGAPLFPRKA